MAGTSRAVVGDSLLQERGQGVELDVGAAIRKFDISIPKFDGERVPGCRRWTICTDNQSLGEYTLPALIGREEQSMRHLRISQLGLRCGTPISERVGVRCPTRPPITKAAVSPHDAHFL